VHLQRLHRVGAAGRVVAAGRRQHRRDEPLVPPDRCDEDSTGDGHRAALHVPAAGCPALRHAARKPLSKSEASDALRAEAAAGKARITRSVPAGRPASLARIRGRSRRVSRCRTTELPTLEETTNPARTGADDDRSAADAPACSGRSRCSTRCRVPARCPYRTTAAKSPERRNFDPAGSTGTSVPTRRLRPTVRCGPCAVWRPEWPGRRGCASATGNRASWHGGDCSAGRCACSRGYLHVGSLRLEYIVARFVTADSAHAPSRWSGCS